LGNAVKRELLGRLTRLGPLPDDATIGQSQLDEFGDVVDRIGTAPPDPDYVRPLLGAFGYGDGFGLYTHGVSALLRQDRAAVVAAALDALEGAADGPRQWALETLRRLREGGHPAPPTAREVRLVEGALRGPPLLAHAAVYWAYWVGGPEGRRLLDLGSRVAAGDARARAAELLAE
jgi:hypothetical protein